MTAKRAGTTDGDAPHQSTRRVRWGMLFVMLAMGLSLVLTAVKTWADTREAAAAVAQAKAFDLFLAVRRAVREAIVERETDLGGLRDELAEAGLRYVGLFERDGELILEAGRPIGQSRRVSRFERGPEPIFDLVDGRMRLEAPLQARPGGRGRGVRLVIEVEPLLATSLEQAAFNQLIVSVGAALALIVLALVFWRLGLRSDRLEALRARDRRLAALGEMSAVLGHELRNPLASLKGHAQLVLERMDEADRSKKNVERVVNEAVRLERLMAQILEFARTGALELREESVGELVRAAIDKVGDPRIATRLDGSPETWRFDRARMEQVLVNLLVNAVEASPSDGAIEISAGQDRRGELVLSVRDSGRGFPPDPDGGFDSIFEPFRTTGKIYGTGLGLAIARRIVSAHGGTITAENAAGHGAIVTISLPR